MENNGDSSYGSKFVEAAIFYIVCHCRAIHSADSEVLLASTEGLFTPLLPICSTRWLLEQLKHSSSAVYHCLFQSNCRQSSVPNTEETADMYIVVDVYKFPSFHML